MGTPGGDLLALAMEAAHHSFGTYGLVGRCRRRPAVEGLPSLPVYVATGPRRDSFGHPLRTVPIGTGVSDSESIAWLQAVVEVLERFCLLWPGHLDALVRASIAEVGGQGVAPSTFGLFSDEQYRAIAKLASPRPDDELDWTWAWSLTRDEFVLVPAALVYGSVRATPPNNFVHALSSTGVATHVSIEAALLAGVLEAVERDAVMLNWLHRRTPRRISADDPTAPAVAELLREHFAVEHFSFELLDMTADSGLPTIACLALSDDPARPAAVMGSATRLDPTEAARKALFEAAQILSSLAGLGCDSRSALNDAGAVRSFDDHARYYAGAQGAAELAFLTEGAEQVPLSALPSLGSGSVSADLETAVDAAARAGMEVLAVDLTTPEVARLGFHTVKVLTPPAVDINADVRFPLLGSERIQAVPETLGWDEAAGADLNLAPCPLP